MERSVRKQENVAQWTPANQPEIRGTCTEHTQGKRKESSKLSSDLYTGAVSLVHMIHITYMNSEKRETEIKNTIIKLGSGGMRL